MDLKWHFNAILVVEYLKGTLDVNHSLGDKPSLPGFIWQHLAIDFSYCNSILQIH